MEEEKKEAAEFNPSNSNSNSNCNESQSQITDDEGSAASRTPFTNLSQVDADLALARTLQEQERAYMMLRMNGEERDGAYGSSEEEEEDDDDENEEEEEEEEEEEAASYVDDEDDNDDDALDHTVDPSAFTSDEAFARALQDAEEQELAARMMALSGSALLRDDWDAEDNDAYSQDTWEEVDPDELSYEELLALGEVVGTESRGLSAEKIASLPSVNYKAQSSQDCSSDQCVICRLEYEDEDTLTVLSCKHIYHSDCINNWLQINKVCPLCSAEVSTSDNR